MKRYLSLLLCVLLTGCACAETPDEHPVVRIDVEGFGSIYAELYPETAPATVDNFLSLVASGFYDGLTFHRIISGFMIQGGDPLGNGTGGSGHTIRGEFSDNGVDNALLHERGVLSMARSSNPDSASSQFFIMHGTSPHLDGKYAAFGRVLAGMETVDRICGMTPVQDSNGTVNRQDQPVIRSISLSAREEAEQAAAAEAENGCPGGIYRDPSSTVSFPVPEDWATEEAQDRAGSFRRGEDQITVRVLNYWVSLSPSNRASLTQRGLTRTDISTGSFTKESLVSLLGADPEQVTEEEHNGILYYRSGQSLQLVGSECGIIILMTGSGDASRAIEYMLDGLTVK